MEKRKFLFITQEMQPYTAISDAAQVVRKLPQHVQDNGMEIRILMPRFGSINERRHRLHEVVRLSGMNIIVDDDDYPLIIKVASLPGARMQVYFLDNDDFFKRKGTFADDNNKPYDDNIDRMVFFCKGALETVRKFGWAPDIISCHGWMTSLLPLYTRSAYRSEPLFQFSKIIYSVYQHNMDFDFNEDFLTKASINQMDEDALLPFKSGEKINLHQGAMAFSDGVIKGNMELDAETEMLLSNYDRPVLDYKEEDVFIAPYMEFFDSFLEEQVEN